MAYWWAKVKLLHSSLTAHELVIKTETKLEKKEDIPFDVTISSDNKTTHF